MPKGQAKCENQSCSMYGEYQQIEIPISDVKNGICYLVCSDCGRYLTGWVTKDGK